MMIAQLYSSEKKAEWDEFVAQSRNATFLFYRNFMDYHQDRFEDRSLMVYKNEKLIALFPATWHQEVGTVKSHGGLTYGGLLLSQRTRTEEVISSLQLIANHYKHMGCLELKIKPIPYIYHLYPSQEELYALFLLQAQVYIRKASSTVVLSQPLSFSTLRKRQRKKAIKYGCNVDPEGNMREFWKILTQTLQETHHVLPVHSLEEISLLRSRFPDHIKCVTVLDAAGNVVGGTLLFCCQQTVHAQYIAANQIGKSQGALDLLFTYLLEQYQSKYVQEKRPLYFDFGISTESGGQILNEGLIAQKEGFGAHTTVYDEYIIDLTSL